jgi:hypothetical protein
MIPSICIPVEGDDDQHLARLRALSERTYDARDTAIARIHVRQPAWMLRLPCRLSNLTAGGTGGGIGEKWLVHAVSPRRVEQRYVCRPVASRRLRPNSGHSTRPCRSPEPDAHSSRIRRQQCALLSVIQEVRPGSRKRSSAVRRHALRPRCLAVRQHQTFVRLFWTSYVLRRIEAPEALSASLSRSASAMPVPSGSVSRTARWPSPISSCVLSHRKQGWPTSRSFTSATKLLGMVPLHLSVGSLGPIPLGCTPERGLSFASRVQNTNYSSRVGVISWGRRLRSHPDDLISLCLCVGHIRPIASALPA